jgi:hypothetical protein
MIRHLGTFGSARRGFVRDGGPPPYSILGIPDGVDNSREPGPRGDRSASGRGRPLEHARRRSGFAWTRPAVLTSLKEGRGRLAPFKEMQMDADAGQGGTKEVLLVAVYDDEAKAQRAVERMIAHDFPMDMISVLGRVHAAGDDVLGIYHRSPGERIEAWAKQGALWGAIWGALAGAAGMFILPGVGAVLAAGPVAEAIVGALGGAAVAGAAMSGAAAASQLASALHRIGIPEAELDQLHRAIEDGRYLLVVRTARSEAQPWKNLLQWSGLVELKELPYTGIKDLV